MKYKDLLKENKTLQRQNQELTAAYNELHANYKKLYKENLALKQQSSKWANEKQLLIEEIKVNQNPISEILRLAKELL